MPKERVGDIEVRWSRSGSYEAITLSFPNLFVQPVEIQDRLPRIPETLDEAWGRSRVEIGLDSAKALVKVLNRAIRQIENPDPKSGVVERGEIVIDTKMNVFIVGEKGNLWEAWATMRGYGNGAMTEREASGFDEYVLSRDERAYSNSWRAWNEVRPDSKINRSDTAKITSEQLNTLDKMMEVERRGK